MVSDKRHGDKILIIVPAQTKKGGVYNFYQNLSLNLPANYVIYYLDNEKVKTKNKFFQTYHHFNEVKKLLKHFKIKKVILNPSLNLNSVIRDSFYVLLALIYKLEVVVFWRGWNFNNLKYLKFPYKIVTFLLFYAKTSVVLYSKIGDAYRELGYKGNIKLMSTIVNDEIFNHKIKETTKEAFNLIFLSRVERYKGIYELLEAFAVLKLKYPNLRLIIAGYGDDSENVKREVETRNYKDVYISGYVTGKEKYSLLSSGDLFIFPSYSEGMPNAVLEAMAVGLPIITTRVGGLNDFFEDNVMGSFIETNNVNSIVDKVEYLMLNKETRNKMSKYNIEFAKTNFNILTVTDKFLEI